MPNCDQLTGRKRDICEGRASGMSLEKVNQYRANWGLEPLAALPNNDQIRGLGDVVRRVTKSLGIKHCGSCSQRQATLNHWFPANLPRIEPVDLSNATRHLTCHLWPVKGYGAWQWNCDQLIANANLFNGRRIVAVATDSETDSIDAVREYLKDFTDEFIHVVNNPKLREVETWKPMLERLKAHQQPDDVTFSCHGKCVRHKLGPDVEGSTIFRWTQAMYETCLAWDRVRPLLEERAMAGSFRRTMKPSRKAWGPWHYSGTFYWWRNRDVYRRNWEYVPQIMFGTEAWPGHLFKPDEVAVIFADDIHDLYKLEYWQNSIEPRLKEWRQHVS